MTARLPRITGDLGDPKLNEFARDVIAALKSVPDIVYADAIGIVWAAPTTPLYVSAAMSDGTTRTDKPKEVRCTEARLTNDLTAYVKAGGMSWDWVNGQVRVNDIDNLILGDTYNLRFAVVG